jgi:hypothetical protein
VRTIDPGVKGHARKLKAFVEAGRQVGEHFVTIDRMRKFGACRR